MQEHYSPPDSDREDQEREGRSHWFFGVVLIVLMAAAAGLAWYAYPILKQRESSLARIPAVERAADTLQQNLRNMDSRLADWYAQHEELRGRVDKLGQEMRARADSLRKQTSDATAAAIQAMTRRFQDEIERQTAPQRASIDKLETSQEQDQARIASLQQEVSEVRGEVARHAQELARQSDDLAGLHRQIDGNDATTDGELNVLREDQRRGRQDVNAVTPRLEVERFDFEIPKGGSREVTPGVSLAVTGTNFQNRRVNGWVRLAPDGRTIWLRDRSVQEPVVFYGPEDGKKRELVITQVTRQSIAGYLLASQATGTAGESTVAR